jgi:hypothetical protein
VSCARRPCTKPPFLADSYRAPRVKVRGRLLSSVPPTFSRQRPSQFLGSGTLPQGNAQMWLPERDGGILAELVIGTPIHREVFMRACKPDYVNLKMNCPLCSHMVRIRVTLPAFAPCPPAGAIRGGAFVRAVGMCVTSPGVVTEYRSTRCVHRSQYALTVRTVRRDAGRWLGPAPPTNSSWCACVGRSPIGHSGRCHLEPSSVPGIYRNGFNCFFHAVGPVMNSASVSTAASRAVTIASRCKSRPMNARSWPRGMGCVSAHGSRT